MSLQFDQTRYPFYNYSNVFFLYSKLQKRMSQLQAYCMLNIMECNYTCVDNCLHSLKWFQWKEMISFNVVFYDDTTNRWRTKYQVVPSEYVGAQQRFVKTNNFCRSKLGELQISNIIFKYFSTDSHGPHQKPWMTCYPPQKNWRPRKEESFDFEQGSDTLKISFPIIVEIWDCHRFIVFDSKAFFVTPCNAHFVAKKPRSFTTCPSNKAGIWGLLLWRCRHLGGMTHDHDDLVNDSLQSQMSHKKHQKNMGDTWLRCIPILLEPQTMYLL